MGSQDGQTNLDETAEGEERPEGRESDPVQAAPAASDPDPAGGEEAREAQEALDAQPEPSPEEAARAEVARLKDQLLRTAADFENYRKRARRDVEDAERRAREETLREVLPVIDNLERAVQASESAKDAAAVAEGVRMVLRQFDDVASRLDLERIPAIGERFGAPSILVNNAGITRDGLLLRMDDDAWDLVLGMEFDSRYRPCSIAGQIPRLRDLCA